MIVPWRPVWYTPELVRMRTVLSMFVICAILVSAQTGSSTSSGSSMSSQQSTKKQPTLNIPSSASSPRVSLPKQSTNSEVSASTGLLPQVSVAPIIPKPNDPLLIFDGIPVRSELDLDAQNGIFFRFNSRRNKKQWISLSLCNGPGIEAYNTSDENLLNHLDMKAHEVSTLTLVSMYVSTGSSIKTPGPSTKLADSNKKFAQGGWAQVVLGESDRDDMTYIGIWPPQHTRRHKGKYVIQLIASTEGSLENVASHPGLFFDDSDRTNALLTTFNYTSPAPNVSLIVLPTTGAFSLTSITYFNSSFCRIFDLWNELRENHVQPRINSSETSRNTLPRFVRGPDNMPTPLPTPQFNGSIGKAPPGVDDVNNKVVELAKNTNGKHRYDKWDQVRKQFHVSDLQPETNYTAYLVTSANVGVHIKHTLYPSVKFVTKRTENCRLLYNVDFCPDLAYSVPYNPNISQDETLRVLEQMISANYGNFSATLDTFPCLSEKFGVYSSVATCEDCRRSYQSWLCSVAIPRCTDLVDPQKSAASQNGSELQGLPMPPNVHLYPYVVNRLSPNGSRQSYIDQLFSPGDYGELLPCLLTCEMVTRSCPPTIQWQCPLWTVTAQRDYGTFADADSSGFGVGQNGGAGKDGLRYGGAYSRYVAQDAFGHVYCNAMNVDRLYREASRAAPTISHSPWLLVFAIVLTTSTYLHVFP